jgi:hypothetical protein
MRVWFRLGVTIPLAALSLSSCVTVRITTTETAVAISEPLIADLSLKLFLDLASRLVQQPSAAAGLLEAKSGEPSANLRALGIDFESFRRQLAETAGVRPLILFLPHGADLAAEARRQGVAIDSWPELAPPALLSGPEVDVLIVFQSLTGTQGETGGRGPVALTRIASLTGLASLLLTPEQRAQELNPRLYRVNPREWKKSIVFEHTRCGFPESEAMVTKLMYQGGTSEFQTTALTEKNWGPCNLIPGSELKAVTVKQKANLKQPKRPVIIAASYFQYPQPGPLLANWVAVK